MLFSAIQSVPLASMGLTAHRYVSVTTRPPVTPKLDSVDVHQASWGPLVLTLVLQVSFSDLNL